jgi:glycolate oxidase FAD binding subunit
MADVVTPSTAGELAECIRTATEPFEIIGTGTKRGLGRPMQTARTLDMSTFADIIVYEPEELILETGAGARLADIETLIAAKGQHLAFEPPDFSRVLGSTHSGTIGGLIACNLSGPRRIKAGAARDHILGIHGVTGMGDMFKAGARVVKNVTGYDMPKLLTGSYGTLAALTAIILKVLPKPETEETIVLEGLDDAAAVAAMSLAMQSSCEVSGAAYIPGEGTYLRLEGIAPSVAYRRDQLAKALGRPVQVLAARSSMAKWQAIRDASTFANDLTRPLWRLSVTPSDAPGLIATLRTQTDMRYCFDWAGGLIWIELSQSEDAGAAMIRGAMLSGHAMLFRAPDATRAVVDVFQPQAPALAALSARVKASFDPQSRLNPGRMVRGL